MRSLQEYGIPTLEMGVHDAGRTADALRAVTRVNLASTLEERYLIDGDRWTGLVDGIPPLDETRYGAWLPVTLAHSPGVRRCHPDRSGRVGVA